MKSSFVVAAAIGMFSASFAGTRTAVDFVETSGSHYLILDYTPTSNAVVEVKVDNRNVSANGAVFCARGNSTSTQTYTLFYITGNDGWRFDYYNEVGNKSSVKATAGTPVVLKTTPEGLYIDGVKKTSYAIKDFVAGNPMVLFASYQSSTAPTSSTTYSNKSSMRLYYLKAWEDDVLKLDLQPFVNEKAVFGLYDAVSGKEYYPATAFGGGMSGMTLTADPAVIENKVNITYSSLVSGTGSNQLIVRGSGSTRFEQGVSDFSSFTIDNGFVAHSITSGTAVWDDDLAITRGRFRYLPKDNQNGEVSLAKNGAITYGPLAEIQVGRSNGGLYARLNMGTLTRGTGGTLLFTMLTDHIGSDMLGSWLNFRPSGFADGEVLPPTVAIGRVNSQDAGKYRQLRFAKYSTAKSSSSSAVEGLVPADMTTGLDGGVDAIAYVNSSTSISEDTTVGRLVIEGTSTQLSIPSGKTLTIGTGSGSSGLMFGEMRDDAHMEPFAGGGSIDFGSREGIVWVAGNNGGKHVRVDGSKVCFKGSGGMTFAGRPAGFNSIFPSVNPINSGTFAQWTGPTRLCGIHYFMDGQNSIPHAADSGDIYIEGNATYGAALHTPSGFVFNNHLHLSGVGLTEKYRAVWADGQYTFNGPVTMEDDAIVYVNNRWTPLACNQKIDGPGGFGITTVSDGTGYASFNVTNTYCGTTRMWNNAAVVIGSKGTLGQGSVIMDNGRLVMSSASGYVITNGIYGSANGRIHVYTADRSFTGPIDVASVDAKDSSGTLHASILRFGNSLRLSGAGASANMSVVATAVLTPFELSGTADYALPLDILAEDGASIAFSKTGSATVTVEAAAPCASVKVEEGTLVLRDGSAILSDTASISYWLDASDATTLTYDETTKYVTEWRSKVGEGTFKAVFAGDTVYPVYDSTVNGRSAIRFWRNTNSAKRMRLMDLDHKLVHRTTFVVARPTSTYDWMCVVGQGSSDDTKDTTYNLRFKANGKVYVGGMVSEAGYLRIDGRQSCESPVPFAVGSAHVFTAEMSASQTFTPSVGGYYSNRDFNGEICEVIEFNRVLSNAERKYVESYLAKKWGVCGVCGDDAMLNGSAVTVASGATLDLNGHSAKVASLDGTGSIVNSSSIPVTVKVNARGRFKGAVGANVTVEFKKGMSVLIR